MKAAVVVFPGSNCDRDVASAWQRISGKAPQMVWHADSELPKTDVVVLPGGFSYGDYLRCGAMAANAPIMSEVKKHAERGGLVLGICNGFQILVETGLLPGVLLSNAGLKFICKNTFLRVESNESPFTARYQKHQVISVPVAHHDGNYFAPDDVLARIEGDGQVAFRYCHEDGEVDDAANPNGARNNIAGIWNTKRTVLGMMPHPERHADPLTGGSDGIALFESLLERSPA